ncbi:meiosis inhibitor protein 1 isoform X2 [Gouania willdenowi]|uniref:meiosis inhibitor protein 1 isoform X2 n=1 Tax=Gouania willdenowi TaxID=441366 RepID=UPI001054700E|nr:meiosis inhibitor protein 1 isoform X2 [Gouania willdenowi]
MTSEDIVFDKHHFRHDPKWSGRLGPAEGGGLLLCVACVIEIIECKDTAVVKKSFALSGVSRVLKSSPGALTEILQQDYRVCLHLIALLLEMLQSVDDPGAVEKVDQVLVQLLLEVQSEPSFRFVLDEIQKQVNNQFNLKHFASTFTFLGNLLKAAPNVAHCIVTRYVPILEQLCSSLTYPDEDLKASIMYVWCQLLSSAGGSAAQSLPIAIRDRLCILLLQTLAKATSPHLIGNCLGLLWQLVQMSEAVSALMKCPGSLILNDESQEFLTNSQSLEQNQEQQLPDHCPLPLILKKLLLSSDELLQVTSSRCIGSILVHSPSQYSAPFITADIPGFLFDRLAAGSSDVLLWSVYRCLMLMTEDAHFFTQCHSVYGIESLVRSLKESLRLTNREVSKQGLLLLTVILERQPPSVRLFPSGPGFVAVSEALTAGVSSSCLLVAAQAASAAGALFSLQPQSIPVQYKAVEEVIEAISARFSELPLLSASVYHRTSGRRRRSEPNSQSLKAEGFLLQALVCFEAACRLAKVCASEPVLRENTFTTPHKQSKPDDSLESLCQCLLRLCDSVWIPTVIRMCECSPNARILQYFYSILTFQFTLFPALMPAFANKLASTGFFRLAVEHKALLCAGNRNTELNALCCGFLLKLSVCILSHSDLPSDSHQYDVEEVENLLRYNLPSLCSHLSDWPSLLCDYQGSKATQFCAVIILDLSLQQGYRLLPDQMTFSSAVWMLHTMQEDKSTLPRSVLRSALYLLAMTQDKSPSLDGAPLNCINKALNSCHNFSSLYFHHPALLHFIFRYPELAEKFGGLVLELWLTKTPQTTNAEKAQEEGVPKKDELKEGELSERLHSQHDAYHMELVTLTETYPSVVLQLLDIVCTKETPLADRALGVLEVLLKSQRSFETDLCANLRVVLLRALQRVGVENMNPQHGQGRVSQALNSLPLVLKLLCVTQASDPLSSSSYNNMEGVHFKLLYHVSNIAGKLKPANTESLLPAFNYLYCCLSQSPAHSTDRAVSMLLSSSGLMGQLQTIISCRPSSSCASSFSPSAAPPSALSCCCHLLLSSLIILQRVHSAQVHKSVSLSLDAAVHHLLVQKRRTDDLLLVSYLKVLQALLDADMTSEVVHVSTSPDLVGHRPRGVEDGALYPLGSRGARYLSIALSGLILQKHELLLRSAVLCLSSLLGFLWRMSPTTASCVLAQPWSRFLLHCLLNSSGRSLLHPAILRFITLRAALLEESDLLQVIETAEKTGVAKLNQEAAEALRLLLTQVQSRALLTTAELRQRAGNLMEALRSQTPAESFSQTPPINILRIGDVFICLSDFKLT